MVKSIQTISLTKYKRKTCLNITTSASTHVCISVYKRALKKLINTTNVCLVQSKNLFEQVLLCRELVCQMLLCYQAGNSIQSLIITNDPRLRLAIKFCGDLRQEDFFIWLQPFVIGPIQDLSILHEKVSELTIIQN